MIEVLLGVFVGVVATAVTLVILARRELKKLENTYKKSTNTDVIKVVYRF